MRFALRLGLTGLAVVAFAATVVSPQAPEGAAAAPPTAAASGPVWSLPTDATDQLMVMYKDAPEGAQAGQISSARLAALRTVGQRFGVAVDYDRTMGIGSYVLEMGRPLAGTALDDLTAALRSSDPAIDWVVPDSRLTLSSEALMSDDNLPVQWNLKEGPGGIRALDAWDEQWKFAADEGKPGYVPDDGAGPRLVRYGQYNYSWYYKEISGDFTCSASTFGDPAPGVLKRCEVASYWVKVADDGQPITLARGVSKWVRYGWGDSWWYKQVTEHGVCSPSQLGRDPIPNVKKICQVELRTDGGGVVANEGDFFTLGTPATVRYGDLGKWVYKSVPAGLAACNPSYFGSDPIPDRIKHCEIVKSMGSGVTIAVPDRGIVAHPDLDNKLVRPTYNFVERNTDARDLGSKACGNKPNPKNWHGLRVGSVAGAETNNRIGIAGVAPMSRLLLSKIIDCEGTATMARLIDALVWSAGADVPGVPKNNNPARVINVTVNMTTTACNPAFQDAVDKVRGLGGVVVAAAGNNGVDVSKVQVFPVNCRGVISVAGSDHEGARYEASNYGPGITLTAPANWVPVLTDKNPIVPGTPDVDYAAGTSVAAPHVAAVAANMLGKNPMLTPENIVNRLILSARPPLNSCTGCGAGYVDADMAIRSAEARTAESAQNNFEATANDISAPADVAGRFDTVVGRQGTDVYSVDLLPGSTFQMMLIAPGSDPSCYVNVANLPTQLSCDQVSGGYTNPSSKTQRLFIHVAPTSSLDYNKDYTLMVEWDRPLALTPLSPAR